MSADKEWNELMKHELLSFSGKIVSAHCKELRHQLNYMKDCWKDEMGNVENPFEFTTNELLNKIPQDYGSPLKVHKPD